MNLLRADWRIGGEAHPLRRMRFFLLGHCHYDGEGKPGWLGKIAEWGGSKQCPKKSPETEKNFIDICQHMNIFCNISYHKKC